MISDEYSERQFDNGQFDEINDAFHQKCFIKFKNEHKIQGSQPK